MQYIDIRAFNVVPGMVVIPDFLAADKADDLVIIVGTIRDLSEETVQVSSRAFALSKGQYKYAESVGLDFNDTLRMVGFVPDYPLDSNDAGTQFCDEVMERSEASAISRITGLLEPRSWEQRAADETKAADEAAAKPTVHVHAVMDKVRDDMLDVADAVGVVNYGTQA